jgi:hypothetical protein
VESNFAVEVVAKPLDVSRRDRWAEIKRTLLSLGPDESIRIPLGSIVNPTAALAMHKHGRVRSRNLPDGQYIWFDKKQVANGTAK